MASRIQIRRDTAQNWTNTNPTLAIGEQGYEIDTGKFKTGNGVDSWTNLLYIFGEASKDAAPTTNSTNYVESKWFADNLIPVMPEQQFTTTLKDKLDGWQNKQSYIISGLEFDEGSDTSDNVGVLRAGIAYINGKQVEIVDTAVTTGHDVTEYLDLKQDGTIDLNTNASAASDAIRLWTITTDANDDIVGIVDTRKYFLDSTDLELPIKQNKQAIDTLNGDISMSTSVRGIVKAYVDANASGGLANVVKDAGYTSVGNEFIFCDTVTNGAFTVTLPDGPTDYTKVVIHDYKGSFNSNNLTITSANETIEGGTGNLVCNVDNDTITLVLIGSNWNII